MDPVVLCAALRSAIERAGSAVEPGLRCLGRTPEEFVRLLWTGPGEPPSGLELNAPLWYATGFAEACTAVNFARHYLDPTANVFPGHSSNMR